MLAHHRFSPKPLPRSPTLVIEPQHSSPGLRFGISDPELHESPVSPHMKPRARPVRSKPRVHFRGRRTMTSQDHSTPTTPRASSQPQDPHVTPLFTAPPLIRDDLSTASSQLQDATVKECLPYLGGAVGRLDYNPRGVPRLTREKHVAFLRRNLGTLPAPYVGADASRPWLLYWCLTGLTLLGEDVSSYRERLVETARTMQNVSGGFGGGHGQMSHLATTYAVVLALTVAGGEEAYEVIDRRAMWKWLCSLKQPEGGFQMALGGEVDVRYVLGCSTPCFSPPRCRLTHSFAPRRA